LNKIDAPEKIVEKSKAEMEANADIKPFTNYLTNIRKTNKRTKKASHQQAFSSMAGDVVN
jgi:hypothetical protein